MLSDIYDPKAWRPYEPCYENEFDASITRAWQHAASIHPAFGSVRYWYVWDGPGNPPGNHGRMCDLEEVKRVSDLNERLADDDLLKGYAHFKPWMKGLEIRGTEDFVNMTSKQWSAYMRSPGPLGGHQIPREPKDRRQASMPQNFGSPPRTLQNVIDDAAKRFDARPRYRASIGARRELGETATERGTRIHKMIEDRLAGREISQWPRQFDLSDT